MKEKLKLVYFFENQEILGVFLVQFKSKFYNSLSDEIGSLGSEVLS